MELISRQAVIEAVRRSEALDRAFGYGHAVDALRELPSAQPERKTGHWIKTARWGRVYYCDQCRNYLDFDGVNVGRGSANFCPNCGAKMRGEQDG